MHIDSQDIATSQYVGLHMHSASLSVCMVHRASLYVYIWYRASLSVWIVYRASMSVFSAQSLQVHDWELPQEEMDVLDKLEEGGGKCAWDPSSVL